VDGLLGRSFLSTCAERRLVAHCVERLEEQLPDMSREFYACLFTMAPTMQSVFTGSAAFRQRKFVNVFLTFRNLKALEELVPLFMAMGTRHRGYHRKFQVFLPAMWEALRETLQCMMGALWTPTLEQAWKHLYCDVAGIMTKAAISPDSEWRSAPGLLWTGQERRAGWLLRSDEGLLAAIGGEPVVRRVHEVLYAALFEDPWLGQFFFGKHQQTLIDKQTEFMVSAFGGSHLYRGGTPAMVHMHMYITEELADLRERYLRFAIVSQGLSDDVADRWQVIDRLFRPSVIKTSAAECVLLCVGQSPVQAVKPPGYQEPVALLRPCQSGRALHEERD
jgi:hemoglobin-like flavoprotein/truncated hemoglobin YjbI